MLGTSPGLLFSFLQQLKERTHLMAAPHMHKFIHWLEKHETLSKIRQVVPFKN